MVQLGELSWVTEVAGAQSAKAEAESVGSAMEETASASSAADDKLEATSESTEDVSNSMSELGRQGGVLSAVMGFVTTAFTGLLAKLGVLGGMLGAIKAAIAALLSPIGLVVAAVAAFAAAWITDFGDVRSYTSEALGAIRSAVVSAAGFLRPYWESFLSAMVAAAEYAWPRIQSGFVAGLKLTRNIVMGFVSAVGPAWEAVWGAMATSIDAVSPSISSVAGVLRDLNERFNIIHNTVKVLVPVLAAVAAAFVALKVIGAIVGVLGALASAASVAAGAVGALAAVVGALSLPILAVVAAVALLAAAWYTDFAGIRGFTEDIFGGALDIIKRVASTIVPVVSGHIGKLAGVWKMHAAPMVDEVMATMTAVLNIIEPMMRFSLQVYKRILSAIAPIFNSQLGNVLRIVKSVMSIISTIIVGALDGIMTTFRIIMALIRGDWKQAWNLMTGLLDRQMGRVISIIKSSVELVSASVDLVIQAIKAPFEALYNFLVGNSLIPDMMGAIGDIISGAAGSIGGAVGAVKDSIVGGFEGALDAVKGVASDIGDAAGSAVDAAGDVADAASDAGGGAVDTVKDAGGKVASAVGFDTGGVVEETGWAVVHKGEHVVPRNMAEKGREGVGSLVDSVKSGGSSASSGVTSGQSGDGGVVLKIEQQIIEIGDQALDLSKFGPSEMKELASLIAEEQGEELQTMI